MYESLLVPGLSFLFDLTVSVCLSLSVFLLYICMCGSLSSSFSIALLWLLSDLLVSLFLSLSSLIYSLLRSCFNTYQSSLLKFRNPGKESSLRTPVLSYLWKCEQSTEDTQRPKYMYNLGQPELNREYSVRQREGLWIGSNWVGLMA